MGALTATDLHVRAGSKNWLRARRSGIGASEIAAVLGVSSAYDSPVSLYHKKRGDLPDAPDNARMEWGRRLEAPILAKFLADSDLSGPVAKGRLYRNDERAWQLSTPDAIAWDADSPAVVEVKTATTPHDDGWGPHGSDEIPLHYRCQVVQTMDVVGARVAFVPCLFMRDRQYRVYTITYDTEEAKVLRYKGERFWHDNVLAGVPPTADGHRATSDVLRSLYDLDPTQAVEVPRPLVEKIQRAKALQKRTNAYTATLENRLRQEMGDAARATVYGDTVATRSMWTTAEGDRRQRLNFKGLR